MTATAALTQLNERFRGYYPVVIDVETGGFNAKTDALLEIAAITLKMDKNGWQQTLLLEMDPLNHPQVRIPLGLK